MGQSHYATLYTISLLARLQKSLTSHKTVLKPAWSFLRYMLVILLLAASISLLLECCSRSTLETCKRFLQRNLSFLCGGVISILAWSSVSYVPFYGLDFFTCIFYVVLLQTIDTEHIFDKIKFFHWKNVSQAICFLMGIALCGLFFRAQWGWLKSYTFDSLHRQGLISTAVKDGRDEVVVPPYSNNASHALVWLESLNQQSKYDSPFYIAYWNTHIIINQANDPPIES